MPGTLRRQNISGYYCRGWFLRTLSEIAFALRGGIPVIGLGTWEISINGQDDTAIIRAVTPQEAVARHLRQYRQYYSSKDGEKDVNNREY
jgi:hypothetical protein